MTSSVALRGAVLLLAAVFHVSQCWDSSNIWFPDTNNPVFYNMTFYQQAAQTVTDNTDNLIPVPEEPQRLPDKRPRPAVFNRLPETPDRFTTTTRRPNVVQRVKKPVRNRPSTSDYDAVPQSDISRLVAEQETFLRNEQNQQRFFGNPARDANVPTRPQSGIERLAAEQQMFIRNEQNGGGATVSPQAGNRRYSADQHNVFVRNEQRPGFYPEIAVGYKTVPLEETTSEMFYADNVGGSSQQLAGNRLRRTKNDGIADGGSYFNRDNNNNGQRWSQVRPEARVESTVFARPVQRAVAPVEENRRRWSNAGSTAGGGDATYRVEDNVIAGRETTSKPAGPSKCVWAIISCCKPSSPQIRYTCFETLGCHGAFWDTNPCSKEMTMAAVQATANFYNIPRSLE